MARKLVFRLERLLDRVFRLIGKERKAEAGETDDFVGGGFFG